MKMVQVEMLSEASNAAVLRLPERAYPGLVLQGDSLSLLLAKAESVAEAMMNMEAVDEDVVAKAQSLRSLLEGYVKSYELAMAAHSLKLPYRRL